MGKIAILGGTFDPVHGGHLLMAEAAVSQFAVDRVIWLPDRSPPHKLHQNLAGFEHRREMVSRAIAERPEFVLSPTDANPTGTSYAIDSFLYLQPLYPDAQWYWIVGSDAFQTLPQWHRQDELARLCGWLVAPRQGEGSQETEMQIEVLCERVAQKMIAQGLPIAWQILEMPWIGVSSSLIRRYCQQGLSIRYLVPEAVRIYIEAQKLYQPQPEGRSTNDRKVQHFSRPSAG